MPSHSSDLWRPAAKKAPLPVDENMVGTVFQRLAEAVSAHPEKAVMDEIVWQVVKVPAPLASMLRNRLAVRPDSQISRIQGREERSRTQDDSSE